VDGAMGNSASGGFDDTDGKSAASRRQENRALYEACIADLRAELKGSPRPAPLPLRCADDASRPRIVLRKRPLFERERASDFDVLSGDGDDDVWGSGPAAALWVTRPMLGLDHDLTLTLRPEVYTESHAFYADAVFDETRSTAELYAAAIRPLAAEALSGGAHATVMCFGQTGSGKTWTTLGILQELARDLPADVQRQIRSAIQGLANSDLGQVVGAHPYAPSAEGNNAEAPLPPVPERFEDIPMSQPIPEAVTACLQWANVGGAVPEAYYTDMHPRLVVHGRTMILRNEGAAPEHRWWTADMILRWWRQNEAHMPFGDNTGVACACIYAIPDEATYQIFKTKSTEVQRMEFCTHVMVVDVVSTATFQRPP